MRLSPMVAALAVASALAGCVESQALRLFPDVAIPDVGTAPWPSLAEAADAGRALPPPPDPAEGAAIAAALDVEAAVMAQQAARRAAPVFEVERLEADAAALRRARAAADATGSGRAVR